MLTYVATIATSAFFVPHYLGGLFWDELSHSPGDVIFTCITIAILGAINIVGVKESTGVNVLLAVVDFLTQVLLVVARVLPGLQPGDPGRQHPPRRRADVDELRDRDPDRDARLHGHRDRLEHVRGGQGRGQRRSRRRSRACALAVFAIYFTLPAVALSALPVYQDASGEYVTKLGLPEEEGGSAGRPGRWAWCARWTSAPLQTPDRVLRRPAGGDDPVPGHQRRA